MLPMNCTILSRSSGEIVNLGYCGYRLLEDILQCGDDSFKFPAFLVSFLECVVVKLYYCAIVIVSRISKGENITDIDYDSLWHYSL